MQKSTERSSRSKPRVAKRAGAPGPGRSPSSSPESTHADAPSSLSVAGSGTGGIRVLCVDDHAVLVKGLKAQFAIGDGSPRINLVGSMESAANLLEETARLKPDVVLLDIEMPGPDVFEVADQLHHMHPRVRFIFLSAHIRDGYLAAAYKCGAWGYFAKGDDLEDIVKGVVEVARSSVRTFVLGPKVRARCQLARSRSGSAIGARRKRRNEGDEPATPLSSLSSREVAVLRLIGKGLSRTQIAKELSRSAKTIDRHQERMIKKLGISSRADLMRFAIREGFAEA